MYTKSLVLMVCALGVSLPCLVGQQAGTPTFTTFEYPGATGTMAFAISKDGLVLGRWSDANKNAHGFLRINGAMVAFDCIGAVETIPNAMNSRLEAVGTYKNAEGKWTGFYLAMAEPASWEFAGAKCVDLEPQGAVGRASGVAGIGISEAGEIAGKFDDANNKWHGYLYKGGVYLTYDLVQGKTSKSLGMDPLGMTPQGEIFGHMQVSGDRMRSWVLGRNKMLVLDFPPGDGNAMTCAFAANSRGEVAGHTQKTGEMVRGMHYRDGVYTDFVVPDSTRTDARGISEDGVIVGFYTDKSGKNKGFILNR